MEWNIVLAVIFGAVTVVGGVETTYQIYKLTVLDAVARGLKHPKLWGVIAIISYTEKKVSAEFYG